MASRRMITTRIPITHYQMTETILNYREILIVRPNNLLLHESTNGAIMPRMSGLSGPSHANEQDRNPVHKIDISATIVKDRNYWFLKSITSVNKLKEDNFCYETPCDNILINSTKIWYVSTCNIKFWRDILLFYSPQWLGLQWNFHVKSMLVIKHSNQPIRSHFR